MIVFIYAVLVFLVLRFSVTLFNFLSNPKLGYYGKHFTDKVSIIVLSGPAEAPYKTALLKSIDQQDYDYIEVLVQAHNESVGQLAERATGRYLLFLKANTTVHHGLINNLIYRAKVFNLAVLSLVPTYSLPRFLDKCSYPLNDFLLLNLIPLRLIRLSSSPAFTAMRDDCLFFDAVVYKQQQWHEKGKTGMTLTELTKSLKQQQQRTELLLGNKQVCARAVVQGFQTQGTHLLSFFGNNILVTLIYLVLVVGGPIVISLNFSLYLIALPVGLIFLSRVMISFMAGQNPLINVVLHPLQMLTMSGLLLSGLWNRALRSVKHNR